MKKIILFVATAICFILGGFSPSKAQSVGIGTATPHNSALLHLNSTSKGFLLPTMTTSQRLSILSPANGIMVYDQDKSEFYQFAGTWRALLNSSYWSRPITSRDRIANTADSVGIGTSAPTERLDVNGNIRSRNRIDADGVIEGAGLSTFGSLYVAGTSLLQGNITAYGSANVSGNINSNTGLSINDVAATLQLKASGVDKGFVQLSGDDLRIGTNSSNTLGKFVIRTNGADQWELDGSTGSNIMRLYASSIHRATISTLNNNNLSISTANTNGLVILNGQMYINNTLARIGIGTSAPTERFHLFGGNIKIENGKLLSSSTGTFDMMPLCYGRINADGSIHTATPNVSVTRLGPGSYDINCSGITSGSVINVTVYGSTRYIGTGSYIASGKMRVEIENIKEVIDDPDGFHSNDDKTFYFVIYN